MDSGLTSAPGETLAELLEEHGITQEELARRVMQPKETIEAIIKGDAAITPEIAIGLERALPGLPADFWVRSETHFRESIRQKKRFFATDWAVPEGPADWAVTIEELGEKRYRAKFTVGVQSFTLAEDEGEEAFDHCTFIAVMFKRALKRIGAPGHYFGVLVEER